MVIPPGYSQVNCIFTGAALPFGAELTFGLDNAVGNTPAGLAAVVAAQWVAANMDDRMVNTVAMTGILVKNGPNDTGPSALTAVNIPGTQAAESLTPNTAALFRKVTGFGGRKGSGRFYLPGYAETGVSAAGVIAAAGVTANQAAATAFLAGLAGANAPMVLLHTDATTPYDVTSLVALSQVASQRRRNRR